MNQNRLRLLELKNYSNCQNKHCLKEWFKKTKTHLWKADIQTLFLGNDFNNSIKGSVLNFNAAMYFLKYILKKSWNEVIKNLSINRFLKLKKRNWNP